MLQLTPEAAVYLRKADPTTTAGPAGDQDILRVAPATADELRGVKLSFVTSPGAHDSMSESQGFFVCVDPVLAEELDGKLIDLTPGGESVYIRSA